MAELEEARTAGQEGEGGAGEVGNWFSARTALRVYGQFVNLDGNRDGMVGPEDLMRYFRHSLSSSLRSPPSPLRL